MTVCPESAILADAHTGWLGLEQSLKPAFPAYSPIIHEYRARERALKHPCRTRRRGFQLVDTNVTAGQSPKRVFPRERRGGRISRRLPHYRMKSVCCRRPRFSWWPGGTCWAYICQRTSGTRLADQEGTPHKSRRAQAKPLPAKASGNSPPQIRDVVPPGSSGGNSMALFRTAEPTISAHLGF
jgi:hypothetical protein